MSLNESSLSMPIFYLRRLVGKERSIEADVHLGMWLAFIAGALNAGGFLAVHQYTSHMTGIVSMMADGMAVGNYKFALAAFGSLICFIFGASVSAVLVNWGRNHDLRSEYALPLVLEALLLLMFGFIGGRLHQYIGLFVPFTVMLLCFLMGLQNAIITKISKSVIRTTHVTGIVTDIGIELGKMCYWNRSADKEDVNYVRGNRAKIVLLTELLVMFFIGGVAGAFAFKYFGFISTIPLALCLLLLAMMPVIDDVMSFIRGHGEPPKRQLERDSAK
jgi:uncharacterized membrane protein YoaK (UPF0700 family)